MFPIQERLAPRTPETPGPTCAASGFICKDLCKDLGHPWPHDHGRGLCPASVAGPVGAGVHAPGSIESGNGGNMFARCDPTLIVTWCEIKKYDVLG